MSRIDRVDIVDLRVPTSDTLLGSDPFHKKPNYSTVLTTLTTDDGLVGTSVNFTAGAGNDWIAYGVRDLAQLVKGQSLDDFAADPGAFHRLLVDHHQLRWLADGVARMAIGSINNALWDLWAKKEGKPLWKLLVDLAPEQVVQSIDWRYLRDALTPEEALEILQKSQDGHTGRPANRRARAGRRLLAGRATPARAFAGARRPGGQGRGGGAAVGGRPGDAAAPALRNAPGLPGVSKSADVRTFNMEPLFDPAESPRSHARPLLAAGGRRGFERAAIRGGDGHRRAGGGPRRVQNNATPHQNCWCDAVGCTPTSS